MTAALEDRLALSLQTQAARVAPPAPGLGDVVIRRGRRVRRRRRVGALACVAALTAGVAVVASSVRTDDHGLPDDSYATTVDPGTWAEGEPSPVPYMIGSLIVDGGELIGMRWDGLEIHSLWETTDGYLSEVAGPDTTSVVDPQSEVASGIRGLVVSADGQRYAWTEIDSGGITVVLSGDGSTQHPPPVTDGLTVAGFLRDERGFLFDLLLQPRGGGPITVWDSSEGGEPQTIGQTGSVFDAGVTGVVLATVDECVTALDSAWAELWQDCGLVPGVGAVSPNAVYAAAVHRDGAIVVKDATTGAVVRSVTPTNASIGELRWENDESLVASVTPSGGEARLARCAAVSGECEWAGPPPPYDRAGQPVDFVLGHPIVTE